MCNDKDYFIHISNVRIHTRPACKNNLDRSSVELLEFFLVSFGQCCLHNIKKLVYYVWSVSFCLHLTVGWFHPVINRKCL